MSPDSSLFPQDLSLESPARLVAQAAEQGSLGLPAAELSPNPIRLRFTRPAIAAPARPLLRLVNARDCRHTALLEVWLGGQRVASVDARIPAQWASFSVDLSQALGLDPGKWPGLLEVEVLARENEVGLQGSLQPGSWPALVVGGGEPFAPRTAWVGVPLDETPPVQRALGDFIHGPGALDYLGWMIGCTTTGLSDLYQATRDGRFLQSLKRRLAGVGEGLPLERGASPEPEYLGNTVAEGLNSRLESFAPVAALARLQGLEPTPKREETLETLGQRMLEVARAAQEYLTSEGCFTLAFPLAAVAHTLGRPEWSAAALRECLRRLDVLVRGEQIIQRAYADGTLHMVNWARGTAWLVLGTAQTALELPQGHPGRKELGRRLAELTPLLLARQRSDSLWNVFTDRPDSGPETSGSAGIAAGLALAAKAGWVGGEALEAARRCARGLEAWLEADGCLGGVSQHNPASEEALQLGYRIRAAWGSGLYAQLVAALTR